MASLARSFIKSEAREGEGDGDDDFVREGGEEGDEEDGEQENIEGLLGEVKRDDRAHHHLRVAAIAREAAGAAEMEELEAAELRYQQLARTAAASQDGEREVFENEELRALRLLNEERRAKLRQAAREAQRAADEQRTAREASASAEEHAQQEAMRELYEDDDDEGGSSAAPTAPTAPPAAPPTPAATAPAPAAASKGGYRIKKRPRAE